MRALIPRLLVRIFLGRLLQATGMSPDYALRNINLAIQAAVEEDCHR